MVENKAGNEGVKERKRREGIKSRKERWEVRRLDKERIEKE